MKLRSAIIGMALILTACAMPFTQEIQIVKVPVAIKCVDQLPEKPKLHTDAEIKAMSDYEATITLLRDRVEQIIYEMKLEAVLEGCR